MDVNLTMPGDKYHIKKSRRSLILGLMKIPGKHTLYNLIRGLRNEGPLMLLDSQLPEHPASEKTYLAAKPAAWIRVFGDQIQMRNVSGATESGKGNAWEALETFRAQHKDWLFGYLGYDLKNHSEDLSSNNADLTGLPDLFFFVPQWLIEAGKDGSLRVLKGGKALTDIIEDAAQVDFLPGKVSLRQQEMPDREAYTLKIREAQKDIYEGDYYEINLSHPLDFTFNGDSLDLFYRMQELGPVPFGAYLKLQGTEVCCMSPERFLARNGTRVWSQPIKGTAPVTEKGDREQIRRLKNSEKERAENLMIVDLVRNDLSHFAVRGSVKVPSLFEIQTFNTVHQMVSTVECEVDAEDSSVDMLKACFPMGSMTGAPKISSMKAIERLEDYRRGLYSGAIGYIAPDQDFDFNVVIRTAVVRGSSAVYPVGGAITSDSDPSAEWEETLVKARAITRIK